MAVRNRFVVAALLAAGLSTVGVSAAAAATPTTQGRTHVVKHIAPRTARPAKPAPKPLSVHKPRPAQRPQRPAHKPLSVHKPRPAQRPHKVR